MPYIVLTDADGTDIRRMDKNLVADVLQRMLNVLRSDKPVKVYEVTLRIIDHDNVGAEEIGVLLENVKYPNHCIAPKVTAIWAADIGEWTDDHPLNKPETAEAFYRTIIWEKCGMVSKDG